MTASACFDNYENASSNDHEQGCDPASPATLSATGSTTTARPSSGIANSPRTRGAVPEPDHPSHSKKCLSPHTRGRPSVRG